MAVSLIPWLNACAHVGKPESDRWLRGMGFVVVCGLAPGASNKHGVDGITDTGHHIFASSTLTPKNTQTNSYGGTAFPRWVDVTWREGMTANLPGKSGAYETGQIIGNYRVGILSRIPKEVFDYVRSGRGAIRLLFRIKDDGVLLAWDVEESVTHPKGGSGFVYSLHGGDFPCETSPYQKFPNCTDGPLEKAPWYNPLWIRK